MKHKIIEELQNQSTGRLIGLSLITYFVYAAHYIKRQTKIINENYDGEDKISYSLVTTILIMSYLSLGLFFAYLFVEETHPITKISDGVDRILNILYIIWGFKARNRMNGILVAQKESKEWFSGLWTFFFTLFYFNFKVGKLSAEVEQGSGADA